MRLTINQFNQLLKYPIDAACINGILARQAQVVAGVDAESFVPSTAKWQVIQDLIFSNIDPNSTLYDLELKAQRKWVGPQGLAPDYLTLVDRLSEYYSTPLPFRFKLSPETKVQLRLWYRQLVGCEWLTPWKYVLASVVRPTGTSTGYDGFTSEKALRGPLARRFMHAARAIADGCEIPHPSIAWYRSQRNAQRTIFGVALSTFMAETHVWGNLVNKWIFALPSSAYKANLLIQEDLLRDPAVTPKRWRAHGVFSFEGDFEHMDTGVVSEMTTFVIDEIAEIVGMSTFERVRMTIAIRNLFNSPLVDFNSDVVMDVHSLLSGQLPTNGLEHHIGVFIMFEALVRACKDIGILPSLVFEQMKFKQQGDDSGAILPDYPGLSDALTLRYVEVATEAQQRVNFQKQRVSRESLTFCKNEFSFSRNCPKGWKFKTTPSGEIPVPRYPLMLAWNSTLNPEDPAPLGSGDAKFDMRIAAVCSIWDNAFGHPAWSANLNYLWQSLPSDVRDLVRSRLPYINSKALKSWEKRVISCDWVSPNSGATVNWISKH